MKSAVLLMAHGSPDRLGQMGEYLRRVMKHREPTPEFVLEMVERYRKIGGRSPLLDVTRRQAAALQAKLRVPVYVGMRHWHPFIADAVQEARAAGVDRLVGVALAPQYCPASVGQYHAELQKTGIACTLVFRWDTEPALVQYWKSVCDDKPFVLFTAHSVPQAEAGSYPQQLQELCETIAAGGAFQLAYQSRSASPAPWLEPQIPAALQNLPGGVSRISVAPIGFVSDHVEILYDLDILHRQQAEKLGFAWERLPMPNDHPLLIEALASVVRKHL
jgi:ferrochelatase